MNGGNSTRLETLNKENYDTWKMQMEALLVKNDAWDYVNGTQEKPAIINGNDASIAAVKMWKENDRKAKSDIILCISPSELKQIKGCETSRDVWVKLENIYQSKGPARKATLLKQLTLQKMVDGDDMHEHIRKFFDAVDKLGEMEVDINPDLLTIMLLYSLPPSFENFRCAIESRDELPTPDVLRIKIVEENEARKGDVQNTGPKALFAGKPLKKPYWKKEKNTETGTGSNETFKFQCHRCQKFGHKAAVCRTPIKNIDEANANKTFAKNAEDVSLYISQEVMSSPSAFSVENNHESQKWCLDSGCSTHLCKDEEKFENLKTVSSGKLNLASSASTVIQAKGPVKIITKVGDYRKNVNLTEALHVPDLRTNLLSVGKITDKGYEVTFKKDAATIADGSGNTKLVAKRIGDLYYVQEDEPYECRAIRESNEITNGTMRIAKIPAEVWHRRLGHLNTRSLYELQRNQVVKGLHIEETKSEIECETCIRGKMTRTPFPKKSNRETELLELVHTDLCGPMRITSNGKAKYMITFIDDYSRWCEVRFLKGKDEALDAFKQYKTMAEKQTGKTIKVLQSDNGTEYLNNKFDSFLHECGITRRLTVPYNPEQNGVAERKNRTLIDVARCFLIQSELNSSFWAEAVSTANYVRNRCPTNSLNGRTPYEKWHGTIPDISHLREFGSSAYTLNRNPTKGKFDDRSRKCIFLGYSEQSKAYRVWLLDEKKIEISRDVRFIETDKPNTKLYDDFCHEDNQLNGKNKNSREEVEIDINPIGHIEPNSTSIHRGHRVNDSPLDSSASSLYESVEEERFESGEDHVELRENDIEPAEDRIELREEHNDSGEENGEMHTMKRGRGRPKRIMTGNRGRPKKDYHMYDPNEGNLAIIENAFTAEISLKEAVSGNDADDWRRAIGCELKSIIKNDTWEIVDRPKNQKVIGCRVVLRNKYDSDGCIERRKARIVAKGFTQRPGIDFNQTFAPVARISSIRLMMALAVQNNMTVHQIDVTTAYLNGTIDEEIYMALPELLEESLESLIHDGRDQDEIVLKAKRMLKNIQSGDKVCLLKKALYGLRQAGRQWNTKLNEELTKLGAQPLNADPCVYLLNEREYFMLIAVYVDDIIIASQNEVAISNFKNNFAHKFEIKDLGKINYCLGIEFFHDNDKITMKQKGYVNSLLDRFGMVNANPVRTPLDYGTKMTTHSESSDREENNYPYRELVGALMYLAITTRPDISHAVSSLGQFNNCYNKVHWNAAKRVLRYLKGTLDYGLTFEKNFDPLRVFVDSDWGNCTYDRRSFTGYICILSGGPVSWESKKQRTVALSSTEAEYMGLTEAAKEAIHLRNCLLEMGFQSLADVVIYNDNIGAQKLAENPVFHARTKHIDIRHHFVRDALKKGLLCINHIPTDDMAADILTKGLPGPKHIRCMKLLGLKSIKST